jgi:hypothetical protein
MTPMILQIRNASSMCRSQRVLIADLRPLVSFLALLFVMAPWASSETLPRQPQDSSAKPTPAPPSQQSAPAPPNPSSPARNDPTPLQKAVHQRKVLTEEDLVKPAKVISPGEVEGEENNPLCDLSCEADLREQMGYGSEREAEFRNQMTLARHDISDDRVWNYTLQSALDAAGQYCGIQRQKAQILSKGNASLWMRDQVKSRFAEREDKMVLDYKNSLGLLTQRIQAVQRFAPFQAAVMQYQVSEATARACPDFTLP